jgi:hypothetical protein
MRAKGGVLCAPPAIVPVGPCVCRFFDSCIAFSLVLELPRRGSAKEGGIRDARAKVRPFNSGGQRPRDTATVRSLRWQRFLYRLSLGVANQEVLRTALVKKFCAGA